MIDRFGNAVTNLVAAQATEVRVGNRVVPLARTYADVAVGEPVALVGSSGLLEIAIRNGNSAESLGLQRGDAVRVRDGARS